MKTSIIDIFLRYFCPTTTVPACVRLVVLCTLIVLQSTLKMFEKSAIAVIFNQKDKNFIIEEEKSREKLFMTPNNK